MVRPTAGNGRFAQLVTCGLLLFTFLVAPAAALPQDLSSIFKRQSSTLKNDLGWQLSGGSAAIIEPSDGMNKFNEAKSRWSDYGAPGVAAVVNAATEQDIIKTIQYANSKNKKFLIQNSGHGWSTMSSLTDLIIIKVETMKKIVIDTVANTVVVGPGVKMGELITALFAQQRQTTLGTCDCPGVIGALLGGGHGRLQGKYGLLLDQLSSARIILHNGTIVTASTSQNADLFWGIRGAGHNFGVVTEATIKIYPVDNGGNHYNAVTFYDDWQLEDIFSAMNNVTLPERSSAYVMFFHEPGTLKPFVAIDFTYAGRPEDGKAILTSVFDWRLPQWSQRQELVLPWSELNKSGMLGIAQQWCLRGWRKNTFSTGIKTYNLQDVRNVWNGYKQLITQYPMAYQSMYIWETYPMQGMRNRDSTATAYANRDVNHIVVGFLIYEDANLDSTMNAYGINAFRTTLNAHDGFNGNSKVYLNYGHGLERKAEFYGWEPWRQNRLIALKKAYDPEGRFNAYHPVPTTNAGFTASP